MVNYKNTKDTSELKQILSLQAENLPSALSGEEQEQQGFVTVQHDFPLLRDMAEIHGHVVAVANNRVVGYALVMLPNFANRVPKLQSMFERLGHLSYRGRPVPALRYFVIGQICVAHDYRGKGVFKGLYQQMKTSMSPFYEVTITEVATRNPRSRRAHQKVGFQRLETNTTHPDDPWEIIVWDFSPRDDNPGESTLLPD